MITGILLSLLVLTITLWAIKTQSFFNTPKLPKSWLYAALVIKLLAGVILTSIYTFHYADRSKADIYKYYDDAKALNKAQKDDSAQFWDTFLPTQWQSKEFTESLKHTQHWDLSQTFILNDNRSLIRLNYLLLKISSGFYPFHLLIFCLLSFLGSFALFRFFQLSSSLPQKIIFLSVFGIPSLLFWSSAMLKESVLLFNMGFLLFFTGKLFLHSAQRAILPFAIFLLLSITVKPYFLAALSIPLLFYILHQKLSRKTFITVSIYLIFPILGFIIFSSRYLFSNLRNKLQSFKELAATNSADSLIQLPTYDTFLELFQTVPLALYNVFIHPLFPPQWKALSTAAALEHFMLLSLLLLPVFAFKKRNELPFFFFCTSLVLILAVAIGLTTPVLGAIVRYKAPFLPFYVMAVLTFVELKQIPFLKKLQ